MKKRLSCYFISGGGGSLFNVEIRPHMLWCTLFIRNLEVRLTKWLTFNFNMGGGGSTFNVKI